MRAMANSSRVLNLMQLTTDGVMAGRLKKGEGFFRNEDLNRCVIIKHRLRGDDRKLLSDDRLVGTKIFVIYDEEDADRGGKYMYLGQKGATEILQEHFGLDTKNGDKDAEHDVALLSLIDELPSLDPFLLRERIRMAGFDVNPFYYRVNEADYQRVRKHVAREYMPLAFAAMGDAPNMDRLVHMIVEKMWEVTDFDVLGPMIRALEIDQAHASDILFAWKGFIYYKVVMNRIADRFNLFTRNLKNTKAVNVPTGSMQAEIDNLRPLLIEALKSEFARAQQEVDAYNHVYRYEMIRLGKPKPFTKFLKQAPQRFETLGAATAGLDHALNLWWRKVGPQSDPIMRGDLFLDLLQDFAEGLPVDQSASTSRSW